MSSVVYPSASFPNGLNVSQLVTEIGRSTLAALFQWAKQDADPDFLTLDFSVVLSGAQQLVLDVVVNEHFPKSVPFVGWPIRVDFRREASRVLTNGANTIAGFRWWVQNSAIGAIELVAGEGLKITAAGTAIAGSVSAPAIYLLPQLLPPFDPLREYGSIRVDIAPTAANGTYGLGIGFADPLRQVGSNFYGWLAKVGRVADLPYIAHASHGFSVEAQGSDVPADVPDAFGLAVHGRAFHTWYANTTDPDPSDWIRALNSEAGFATANIAARDPSMSACGPIILYSNEGLAATGTVTVQQVTITR